MDTCSAVMLSGHKPQVADAVIEAVKSICSVRITQWHSFVSTGPAYPG